MRSLVEGEMSVVLPEKNADAFLDLFLESNTEKNSAKDEYFARTYLFDTGLKERKNGLIRITIGFDAADSLKSCLIEKNSNRSSGIGSVTLEEACKKYGVKRAMVLGKNFEENGEESILYETDRGISYEERRMFPQPCQDSLTDADFEKERGEREERIDEILRETSEEMC